MYNLKSMLFLYKFIFMIEIVLVESVIGIAFGKKKNFLLRLAIVILVLFAVTFALPIVVYESWYLTILFVVMFASSIVGMEFLYTEPLQNLLLNGIFAYSVQHLSYSIGAYIVNMAKGGYQSVYTDKIVSIGDLTSFTTSTSIYIFFLAVVFVYIMLFFNKERGIKINNFSLVTIAGVMIIANVILNAVAVYEFENDFSKILYTLFFAYDILTAAMVVWLLFFAIGYDRVRNEMQILSVIRNREKQNYTIKKERIDSINMMCHDLRHQIEKLRKSAYDDAVIKEMEQSIDSCVSIQKTGNPTLDVILGEAALTCGKFGIKLSCLVDGHALDGIAEQHLYSIFDNLINNAVDAVMKISEEKTKYIKVIVSRKIVGAVSVLVENPYENDGMKFTDGLPQTSSDFGLHGYGLRSVKSAVDALNGAMKITAEDGVFGVSIVLPVEE